MAHTHTHTDTHTNTPRRNPLNNRSDDRTGRYVPTQHTTQHTNIHHLSRIRTCDCRNQAAETYALHYMATGIGRYVFIENKNFVILKF